jgi:hypothetical protein
VALPEPKPGLVIRYDYLWNREAAAGRDQGKDRPACLVAASDPSTNPRFVVILPITHSAPTDDTIAIAIPPRVRQMLGFDDEPCWVIISEHNIDEWPNGGLQPLPRRAGEFSYGFIPPSLFAQIKTKFLELAGRKQSAGVRR